MTTYHLTAYAIKLTCTECPLPHPTSFFYNTERTTLYGPSATNRSVSISNYNNGKNKNKNTTQTQNHEIPFSGMYETEKSETGSASTHPPFSSSSIDIRKKKKKSLWNEKGQLGTFEKITSYFVDCICV